MLHQIASVNPVPAQNGSLAGFEVRCSCGDVYRNSLSESSARRDHADHARYMAAKSAKATRKRVA